MGAHTPARPGRHPSAPPCAANSTTTQTITSTLSAGERFSLTMPDCDHHCAPPTTVAYLVLPSRRPQLRSVLPSLPLLVASLVADGTVVATLSPSCGDRSETDLMTAVLELQAVVEARLLSNHSVGSVASSLLVAPASTIGPRIAATMPGAFDAVLAPTPHLRTRLLPAATPTSTPVVFLTTVDNDARARCRTQDFPNSSLLLTVNHSGVGTYSGAELIAAGMSVACCWLCGGGGLIAVSCS